MSFRSKLVGAWELIEYNAYLPNDQSNIYHPMGANAQGIIMYTPDGYMSAQLQTPGVPAFEPPGTDTDWSNVGRNYVSKDIFSPGALVPMRIISALTLTSTTFRWRTPAASS